MTVLVRVGTVAASRRFAFELVKPSSVTVTGGGSETATISALGSVEFSAATALSLNDVFSSGYDNYMLVASWAKDTSGNPALLFRYRASGSDATGTDYTYQFLLASSTSVSGLRLTSDTNIRIGTANFSTVAYGATVYLYGPALAQPTASRNVGSDGNPDVRIFDVAGTHSLSTAYDGITVYSSTGEVSGRVAVYGMRG